MLYYNLNKIIQSTNKILFIDTNSSFSTNYNETIDNGAHDITDRNFTGELLRDKVIHKNDIYEFNQLFIFLYSLYRSSEIKEYSFIIIDSLSLIANKFNLNKEDELFKEFNNIVISLVNKYNVGFIFTSTSFKIKNKIFYDFSNTQGEKTYQLKETESNLNPNIILLQDYTLYFMTGNYNFTINGFKTRKNMLRVKKEKGYPIDKLIEL